MTRYIERPAGSANRVRLVQCLCPQRHCLMANAYEEGNVTSEEAIALLRQMVDRLLNPWCALCNSRELTFEDAPLPFRTIKEAAPHLGACASAQAATRQMIEAARRRN